MSDSMSPAPFGPARSCDTPCDPWKFWATGAWTAVALAAWVAVQFLVFIGMLFYLGIGDDAPSGEVEKLAAHAVVISLIATLSIPAEIGVVALAIRFARCRFADYVALVWPSRHHLLAGIVFLVVLLPLADIVTWMSGRSIVPPFVIEAYKTARDSGTLWLFTFALVVAAPLTEEIVFRGFMYRGLAASRAGVAGAIVIPSAIWAVMHVQYENFFIIQIFLLGVIFGVLRWQSGSTWLTIVLHGIVNLSSLLQTVYFVEKAGQ